MSDGIESPRLVRASAPTQPKRLATQPFPDKQVIEIAFHLNENTNINPYLAKLAATPVPQRVYLTDDNFDPTKTSGANYFGAYLSDVAEVENWVAKINAQDPAQQLTITRREYDMHGVKVEGTVKQISTLFNIDLAEWLQDSQSLGMGHTKDATIPAELAASVRGIVGLNTLGHFSPQWKPGPPLKKPSKLQARLSKTQVVRTASHIANQVDDHVRRLIGVDPKFVVKPMYPDEIATRQNVPVIPNQVYIPRLAIFEYAGRTSQVNLTQMAKNRNVDQSLITNLDDGKHRFYSGGIPQDNKSPDANGECDLDGQSSQIGLASKGIRMELLEVNAEDTEMGAGDTIAIAARALGHPLGGAGADIGSESWGDPEIDWTPQSIEWRRTANKFALLKGVPILVATGDNGSRDKTLQAILDFYAGDDLNFASGGITAGFDINGKPMSRVWSGTGGGVNSKAKKPYYQKDVNPICAIDGKTGRGSPDGASDADPASGCITITGDDPSTGKAAFEQAIGGTSLAAPTMASHLLVPIAQTGKRLGPLHGLFYGMYRDDQQRTTDQRIFRDITIGSNGDYSAQVGWDPCTGVGEIADVGRLAAAIMSVQPIVPILQFTLSDQPRSGPAPQLGLQ